MNDKVFEALNDLFDLVTCQGSFEKGQKCYDIIEEALTTKSKKEQAFEIIKEKNVDVFYLRNSCETFDQYNRAIMEDTMYYCYGNCRELTEDEFDLLKEVLENE